MWIIVLQRITVEFFLDLLYFPIWWYTAGAKRFILGLVRIFQEANMMMVPGLWLKNIFVPMFGQYDWQGRIMSFFVRLANVIFRSIGLFIWLIILVIFYFIWLLFPLFVIYMFVNSLI
ncbi:hypothetical protein KJ641_02535 [Patescibacteria group bacterium]|nr:hypothetical protein [Patescibacteria group bacterium]MBU1895722.1 hypothetical protein [Patescibacteria group bacterium]